MNRKYIKSFFIVLIAAAIIYVSFRIFKFVKDVDAIERTEQIVAYSSDLQNTYNCGDGIEFKAW